MADSAFLSRLPVRGAVFESSGVTDAFKVPLLNDEGKIDLTLISNSATIFTAANTAARLQLTSATPGDFCTQSDNNSIYFLKVVPATAENSWVRLSTIQDSAQDFDSPNFTGIPTAPTASIGTNTTQLATTAFVKNLTGDTIPAASATSGSVGTSPKFARADHVHPADSSKAPIASPEFTGQPKAPTPDHSESTTTRVATVGFVKQQSIDGFYAPRAAVDLNSQRITSLGTPLADRDAATKSYVDAMQSGFTIREPVRVATTTQAGNINLNGSVTTIDGVALANGDRVLVKNQTNGAQNGIYVVNLNGTWLRASDADSSLELRNGVYMFVLEGVANSKSGWYLVTSGNIVLNSTPLNFVYYTRQDVDQVTAGFGLIRETNTIATDPAVVATVTSLNTKQATLVSGTNIKTINNSSLLGSGNIAITKADVGLDAVNNTSDLAKPISTLTQAALDLKVNSNKLGAASGVATLDASSKLTASQLPDLAVSEYLGAAASQTAMLALTGQKGDWVNRSDTGTVFIITGNDTTQLTSWTQLNYPAGQVASVAGKTGVVTLAKADVGLDAVNNTSDLAKPISTLTQTALDAKQATLVSGTNIKTVNNINLLGSGNITLSTGNVSVAANTGLAYASDTLSTIYNSTMSDSVISTQVGGAAAAAASTWKNKTIVQVLDTILFPDVAPTYTIPTIAFTASASGVKEVGELITQSLTVVGTKNDAGAFTMLRVLRGGAATSLTFETNNPNSAAATDVANQFGYTNPNSPNYTYTGAWTDTNFAVPYGLSTWSSAGNYNAGLAKKNNKNVTDSRLAQVRSSSAPQAASTGYAFTGDQASVTGIYPYYWGIVSGAAPTKESIAAYISSGSAAANRVVSSAGGDIAITFGAVSQYVWFAHANVYSTKTTWYQSSLNNGNIGAQSFIASPLDQAFSASNSRWTNVQFKVYISPNPTTTEGQYLFR